jgi:hypothetical protein
MSVFGSPLTAWNVFSVVFFTSLSGLLEFSSEVFDFFGLAGDVFPVFFLN